MLRKVAMVIAVILACGDQEPLRPTTTTEDSESDERVLDASALTRDEAVRFLAAADAVDARLVFEPTPLAPMLLTTVAPMISSARLEEGRWVVRAAADAPIDLVVDKLALVLGL